jgi:hypothetical protein
MTRRLYGLLAAVVVAIALHATSPAMTAGQTGGNDAAMHVSGSVWVDARPAGDTVRALVGDVVCAEAPTIRPMGAYVVSFAVEIPAAEAVPGCGSPGADVHSPSTVCPQPPRTP